MENGDAMPEDIWYDCCSSPNAILIVDDPSNGSLIKTRSNAVLQMSSENCGDSENNKSYRTLHGRKDKQLSPTPGCSKTLHGNPQLQGKSKENVGESVRPSREFISCNISKTDVNGCTNKIQGMLKGPSGIPIASVNRSSYKRGCSPTSSKEENCKPIFTSEVSLYPYCRNMKDSLCPNTDTDNSSVLKSDRTEKLSTTTTQGQLECSSKNISHTPENVENSKSGNTPDAREDSEPCNSNQIAGEESNRKTAKNSIDIWENITKNESLSVPLKCNISPTDNNNTKSLKSTLRNTLSKYSQRLLPLKPQHLNGATTKAVCVNQMTKNETKSTISTADKACNTKCSSAFLQNTTILDCSICFDSLLDNTTLDNTENETKDDITVVATACGHIFHEKCIKEWLNTQRKRCPICCTRCRSENLRTIFIDAGARSDSCEGSNEGTENKEIQEIHSTLIEDYEDLQLRYDELKAEHEFCTWKSVVIQSLQSAYDSESRIRTELEKENELLLQKIQSMQMEVFVAQSRLNKPL